MTFFGVDTPSLTTSVIGGDIYPEVERSVVSLF